MTMKQLTRQEFLVRTGALGLLASTGGVLSACGGDNGGTGDDALEGELNVIAWAQEWEFAVKPFEQETGVKVKLTFRGDEPLNQVLGASPGTFDVASYTPLGGDAPLVEEGLFQELDLDRIDAWNDYSEPLRELLDGAWGGKHYCAPYYFGGTFLVRNTELVPTATDTWEALWDPAYKKKTAVVDSANDVFLYIATTLGIDPTDYSDENLAQADPVAKELVRNAKTFWSTGDDIKKLVARGDIGLTDMWDGTALELVKAGEPVEVVVPRQGTTGWIDGPGIVVGAPHPNAAYAWINYVLRPEIGAQLAEEFSFLPANTKAFELLEPETAELLNVDTVGDAVEKGLYIFDRAVSADDERKIADWWEKVKLGA
jgi:spermidine/putrescine transport system substrate-binding protein